MSVEHGSVISVIIRQRQPYMAYFSHCYSMDVNLLLAQWVAKCEGQLRVRGGSSSGGERILSDEGPPFFDSETALVTITCIKGLVTNYEEGGEATKLEGGHMKIYPYGKGGGGQHKVLG